MLHGRYLRGSFLPSQTATLIALLITVPVLAQTPTSTPAPSPPSITANPQTSVGEGRTKTTIAWKTGDDSFGEVYVSINGGDDVLFAGKSPYGSQDADWIEVGTYVFRLYAGTEHKKVLAEITVTRTRPAESAQPASAEQPPPQRSWGGGLNPASIGVTGVLFVFLVWVLVRAARRRGPGN